MITVASALTRRHVLAAAAMACVPALSALSTPARAGGSAYELPQLELDGLSVGGAPGDTRAAGVTAANLPEHVIAPEIRARTFEREFLEPGGYEPDGYESGGYESGGYDGYQRVDPVITGQRRSGSGGAGSGSAASRAVGLSPRPLPPLTRPPTAYVLTSARTGVPAWVLFGVALQESQLLFGHETLPWPWTLDVAGRAERHGRYEDARDALAGYLRRGVTNVDCGAMQVNWRAHGSLLASAARALDPYWNLAAGARILADNHAATGDWPHAVGLYHTGSFAGADRRERAVRYVAGVSRRLSRHGLTLAQAATVNFPVMQEGRHG